MRPKAVFALLESIQSQIYKPFEILIIDASLDNSTELLILEYNFDLPIKYFLVSEEYRGITRQRNFGISKISSNAEIVCFLDDDLVLEPNYLQEIIKTFNVLPEAIGVGGIDLKENAYSLKNKNVKYSKFKYYEIDGWVKKESTRNQIRKFFGLLPNLQPDLIPEFSHGRSGFPPNGKTYQVEHLVGMSMCFKVELFTKISFSKYFIGYGLYEDFDFCVRALNYGKLYVNTNAQVWHYHDPAGRPNQYNYGKMVVRNGWYVWRLAHLEPSVKNKMKWHATTLLLLFLRFLNVFTTTKRKEAFTESLGRFVAWIYLFFNKPKIER